MFTGASYARSGDVNIAYQVVGDGPIDLVLTFGWRRPRSIEGGGPASLTLHLHG